MADDARVPFGLVLDRAQLRAPEVVDRGTGSRATGDRIGARPTSEHDRRVIELTDRLHDVSGVRLTDYWRGWPTESWPANAPGFRFESVKVSALSAALRASDRFVAVDPAGSATQRFRELNADPRAKSLHVILQVREGGVGEMHLDSVAIVRDKDRRTGAPVYTGVLTLLQHLAVDKFGKPAHDEFFPW